MSDAIQVASQAAPPQLRAEISKTPEEARQEQERMRDVHILLENLFANEEATIKLIIDCLYDVGSINIANKKIRWPWANRLTKLVASTSKPIFRLIAWRWFRSKCPKLIADWLASKIS